MPAASAKLLQGVRIFSPDPQRFRDRISLSDGVMPATAVDSARPSYTQNAVVPKGNWRPCTQEEWQVLRAEQPPGQLHESVAVIRSPQFAIEVLLEEGRKAIDAPYAAASQKYSPSFRTAMQMLTELLEEHGAVSDSIQPLGLSARRAGQATTTVNERKRRRIGLHLDRWDELSLAETASARIRVNFNLGPASRYFLFVNLPAREMATRISISDTDDADVGRTFLGEHPHYPIIRLRVDPSEAYVAPTDYLIHDATTLNLDSRWDIHLSILAHFNGAKLLEMAM